MKFLIIKDEADGFEPITAADDLSTVIKRFSQLKNKNPETHYVILKKYEEN